MLLSIKELEEAAVTHPEIADYLEKNPRPAFTSVDLAVMRKGMEAMEKGYNIWTAPPFTGSETYHDIPMRDGFKSSLKVQRPAEGGTGPLIVLAFGGGFVGGTNEQFEKTGRILVNLFNATVVSISYRVAPEHKFPAAQNDTQDSMRWIADNATGPVLQADPKKGFIMGGISAGGAMTACFSRLFQEEPLAHPLTAQWLAIPSVMSADSVPEKYKDYYLSTTQQAKGKFFSQATRDWLNTQVEADFTSPLRYAINAKQPLSGQPRTYFQVDGADPLRDDALIYDEMLKEAGVETKVDMYPGCPHGHFCSYAGLDITNRANIDTFVGFGWLLGREVSREEASRELAL
ncbi:uncharacterized protein LTR77_000233 [Saxophila tyrrhenica]|uniref:Alpha/beta hydrolase fold-3 domain-containing protein n=1 Tax=Saxophila tyrrhenica TaxID=1690608 RepID=A0AAV9PMT1_9PEZI|nr:hypothetical protein LTR77_000233 [Saxophila tyrrhenica]